MTSACAELADNTAPLPSDKPGGGIERQSPDRDLRSASLGGSTSSWKCAAGITHTVYEHDLPEPATLCPARVPFRNTKLTEFLM